MVERRIKRCHTGESVQDYDCNDCTIKTCKNSHIWNTQAIEHMCVVLPVTILLQVHFFSCSACNFYHASGKTAQSRGLRSRLGVCCTSISDCQQVGSISHATGKKAKRLAKWPHQELSQSEPSLLNCHNNVIIMSQSQLLCASTRPLVH